MVYIDTRTIETRKGKDTNTKWGDSQNNESGSEAFP
jgi:hypothetical protein